MYTDTQTYTHVSINIHPEKVMDLLAKRVLTLLAPPPPQIDSQP